MEKYSLVGIDGNAYNIMGYVSYALKREGFKKEIKKYCEEAMKSDYDNLIQVSMQYLDKINSKFDDEELEYI